MPVKSTDGALALSRWTNHGTITRGKEVNDETGAVRVGGRRQSDASPAVREGRINSGKGRKLPRPRSSK
jgi:hypothetical protein